MTLAVVLAATVGSGCGPRLGPPPSTDTPSVPTSPGGATSTPKPITVPESKSVRLMYGQPGGEALSLALLPVDEYWVSPGRRYLLNISSRENEIGGEYYPVVYDLPALIEAASLVMQPPQPAGASPCNVSVFAGDVFFWGWLAGDSELLIGCCYEVVAWNPATGSVRTCVSQEPIGEAWIHGGAVSPDGTRLALATSDSSGVIRIEVRSLAAAAEPPLLGPDLQVRTHVGGTEGFTFETVSVVWSADGKLAAEVHSPISTTPDWVGLVDLDAVDLTRFEADRCRWSADGRSALLESLATGRTLLVTGGTEVSRLDGLNWDFLPSAPTVYTWRDGRTLLREAQTGELTPFLPVEARFDPQLGCWLAKGTWNVIDPTDARVTLSFAGRPLGRLPDGAWLWLEAGP